MDPQQVYEDPGGNAYYGEEAKERVQSEWEESYQSNSFTTNYRHSIDTKLVGSSITNKEIETAIHKTGKKGLAWDCITIWVIKLISTTTPSELLRIAKEAEVELHDLDLSWMEDEVLRELEKEDHEETWKLKGTVDKYSRELNWIPKEVRKIIKNALEPWETHRESCQAGNHIIRKLLTNALENEEAICGRLFLM